MLTVIALNGCMEVSSDKTATKDSFVRYDFTSVDVLGLEEESVQAGKRALESRTAL